MIAIFTSKRIPHIEERIVPYLCKPDQMVFEILFTIIGRLRSQVYQMLDHIRDKISVKLFNGK